MDDGVGSDGVENGGGEGCWTSPAQAACMDTMLRLMSRIAAAKDSSMSGAADVIEPSEISEPADWSRAVEVGGGGKEEVG